MIDSNDKKNIQDMIHLQSKKDFQKRIGDTPTDNLQLVNKKYCDNNKTTIYSGAVSSGGSGITLPSGWTSTHNSTGDYSVSHNLNVGATKYVVTACIGVGVRFLAVSLQSSIRFDINTYDKTGTLADGPFQFTLSLAPNNV